MWRIDHEGTHYCSQTIEGLVSALGEFHSVVVRKPDEPFVPVDECEKWCSVITNPMAPLAVRQEANIRVRQFAAQGSAQAQFIVDALDVKALYYSPDAVKLSMNLDKDFALITNEELTENVKNLVLRAKLLNEIAAIYRGLN
jgi:hypothetical protein